MKYEADVAFYLGGEEVYPTRNHDYKIPVMIVGDIVSWKAEDGSSVVAKITEREIGFHDRYTFIYYYLEEYKEKK